MQSIPQSLLIKPRYRSTFLLALSSFLALGTASNLGTHLGFQTAQAAETKADPADEAWKEVEKAVRPPNFPPEWQKERPSREEYAKFIVPHALAASAKAQEFLTKYPKHAKAEEAKRHQSSMLEMAANLGSKDAEKMLAKIESDRLSDKNLSEDERFQIRAKAVQRAAMAKQSEGMAAVFSEYETGARKLVADFPKRSEPYAMLLEVAANLEGDKALAVVKDILASNADDEIKDQAKAIAKKQDIIGKPLPIQFKAIDGREVKVDNMKGKVVLVDFWATWCGPCVAELPNVLAAYSKLNPKGFEIVGISFDQKKEDLTEFVKEHKMPWAQYFDGKGWKNTIGVEYGINSIPAMWLVDKKGNVRDLNARENLAEKVEKLLAEQ